VLVAELMSPAATDELPKATLLSAEAAAQAPTAVVRDPEASLLKPSAVDTPLACEATPTAMPELSVVPSTFAPAPIAMLL